MEILHPPGWAPPIGYANGIAVGPGRIVFIAGQVGWDAQQRFHSEEIAPQFEQALANVLAVLAQAGGAAEHICRITAYCCDKPAYLAARRELGAIWRRHMGDALSGDEHDLRVGPARQPRQDRARGDRRRAVLTGASTSPKGRPEGELRPRGGSEQSERGGLPS